MLLSRKLHTNELGRFGLRSRDRLGANMSLFLFDPGIVYHWMQKADDTALRSYGRIPHCEVAASKVQRVSVTDKCGEAPIDRTFFRTISDFDGIFFVVLIERAVIRILFAYK